MLHHHNSEAISLSILLSAEFPVREGVEAHGLYNSGQALHCIRS